MKLKIEERKKLGQMLLERSYVEPTALERALEQQKSRGGKIGQVLLELGYIKARHLNETLAAQAGISRINLDQCNILPEVLGLIPAELVSKYNVFPLERQNGRLTLAMADPFDSLAIEEIRLVTGLSIRRRYGSPADLEKAIHQYYGSNVSRMLEDLAPAERKTADQVQAEIMDNGEISTAKLHELAREPSLINLVNLVIFEAIDARASDIHIEPFEKAVKIKYRIDGMLIEKSSSPKRLQAAIISRVKIMAGMDIAERFVPQDGHIEFVSGATKIDLRVSTVPTVFGESITMRILDRSAALIELEDLGMNQETLVGYNHCLGKSHGIVLVTGPTGSGKTTTLYASLNKIFDPSLKIITIEDPVEYQLDGIIQMPVNPRRGLTFGRGLRHILRQDPDIIMVGEIRDKETADIAVRAALTGHLVFSTLHTNDAAGAITRLIDMGVEPFLVASSLEGVLAQRLVRKICPACKVPYKPSDSLLESLNNSITILPDDPLYHGKGCEECNGTGMRGRIGIFELLRINEPLRKLIATRPTTEQILENAPEDHVSMRHGGILKILQGVTTPEEVLRATQGIEED
ncbi:MAG: Flp pilus assembly complex ATPase component TadA [Sedimentisphaerales bacterium]|nr:Flp pilus assembly complex ATPase component TadA [Sedimentisphaerales bacterium]